MSVGAVPTTAGDLVIYLQPTLQDHQDIQHLMTALSRETRSQFSLVLTASGLLAPTAAKTVMLDDIIDLARDGNGFTLLAEPCEIVGLPRKAQGGHPRPYSRNLEAMIRERVSNGEAFSGRNEEARALEKLYRLRHLENDQPSLLTIKRHLSNFRAGS